MKARNLQDLPQAHFCNLCGVAKPLAEMIVIYQRAKNVYYVRPRCKACHNDKERGNRREYKRAYLQKWRRENSNLNASYWKDNPHVRERCRVNAARRFEENAAALRIQGRLRRRGENVSLEEARDLLARFGSCYPTRFGLTAKGRRECERIRSRLRSRGGRVPPNHLIRVMVYEDDEGEFRFVIPPDRQPEIYETASRRLKQYHANRRSARLIDQPQIHNRSE